MAPEGVADFYVSPATPPSIGNNTYALSKHRRPPNTIEAAIGLRRRNGWVTDPKGSIRGFILSRTASPPRAYIKEQGRAGGLCHGDR